MRNLLLCSSVVGALISNAAISQNTTTCGNGSQSCANVCGSTATPLQSSEDAANTWLNYCFNLNGVPSPCCAYQGFKCDATRCDCEWNEPANSVSYSLYTACYNPDGSTAMVPKSQKKKTDKKHEHTKKQVRP
jgi:hypothetical protein